MIVKGKNVIGLNIITVDTGTVVDTIDDIAYDPTTHRVEALLVNTGGLFSSAKAIHISDVRSIGEDAVVIADEHAIKSVKDINDTVHSISSSNKHLVKTNVVTIEGKELGRITDIYFDSNTGNVESMEVTQGGLKTLTEGKKSIKPADIVTIGADATIVSTYTESALEHQGEEGGLKGALNDAKAKVSEATDKAKESTQEAVESIKEKSSELGKNAKERANDLQQDVREVSADAKKSFDENSAKARVRAEEIGDDISRKSRELKVAAEDKAEDLKIVAQRESKEIRTNTEKLVDDATIKTKKVVAEVKEKTNDAVDSASTESKKVVEQSKRKFDNKNESVELVQTKIVDTK